MGRWRWLAWPVVTGLLLGVLAPPAWAGGPDPTGAATLEADPQAALNLTWVLLAAFLVFFMQAGFALVEAGFCRAKNALNILTKNFMDFSIAGLAFFAFGFALMFGGSGAASGLERGNSWLGYSGFFLAGRAYDVTTAAYWLFQMVFAATAATIVSGAMAERTRIPAYLAYSFFISALIYPIYGHWVWGGGWLSGLGAVDFAGSGVVHAVGGLVGLAGAAVLGPRFGKYTARGEPNTIPGHNMAFVVLGTFILFFGWFGFNPGSTLAATDLRIAVIATNTLLAGVAGAVAASYLVMLKTQRLDVTVACNGALAGLVGITAPCAFVAPWAAVVIGALAGWLMVWSVGFVERRLRVDDPVGAVSVHGTCGLWGLLAVGIFADGTYGGVAGLIAGHPEQLVPQLVSMLVVAVWALGTGWLLFKGLAAVMGLRAPLAHELEGLDLTEHGLECYVGGAPATIPNPLSAPAIAGGSE